MKKAVCRIKGHIKVRVSPLSKDLYTRDDYHGKRIACRRCRKVLPEGTVL